MKYVPWPAFMVLPFKPLWKRGAQRTWVGDMAPDFSLESPDHKETFQLSSMRGQETGGAGIRQLHVTSVPAGGSRSQQAVRTI